MAIEDYSTLAQIKALMPDQEFGTSYDTIISTLVTRSSRLIDGLLKRSPGSFSVSADQTRYFRGSGDAHLWIGELANIPSVVSVAESGSVDNASGTGGDYTEWSLSDYVAYPYNALAEKNPILRLDVEQFGGDKSLWWNYPKAVKITGPFGFTTTTNMPEEIGMAAEIQTVRWFNRAQQAFADVGGIKDIGQLRYVKRLDPDVEMIIDIPRFQWLSL